MILFENEACMVINKRIGEASESPGITDATMPNGSKLIPVHRLDMPVSGCLLLAKTKEALAFLNSIFADRRVEKRYWAIIEKPAEHAPLLPEHGELIHHIQFNAAKNKSFAYEDGGEDRKKAVMRYRVAGSGTNYLFMEIDLETGRHHQIRAQLAAIGLHIKGDLKYGARRSEKAGGIRLHAHSLSFPDPLDPDHPITVQALPHLMDPLWTAFAEAVGKIM